jgi:integrase
VTKISPVSVAQTRMELNRFAKFLAHNDAGRVTKQDVIRYRTHLISGAHGRNGISNSSWVNVRNAIARVFQQAVKDETLPADPTAGTKLELDARNKRHPYTDAEAARILTAARNETKPSLRWAHWVMAFTGMRGGETLQLLGRDVATANGIPYLIVSDDDPTKSVKTSDRRHIPILEALVAEGFLDYARTIAPDAPLFPEVPLDKYGHRGGRVTKAVGDWVRKTVGITDKSKAPNHSWRHRMEDELRVVEAPEDVRDAIVGHKRQTTGGRYGVRGEALSRLKRYLDKVPVPAGL